MKSSISPQIGVEYEKISGFEPFHEGWTWERQMYKDPSFWDKAGIQSLYMEASIDEDMGAYRISLLVSVSKDGSSFTPIAIGNIHAKSAADLSDDITEVMADARLSNEIAMLLKYIQANRQWREIKEKIR